MAGPGKPMCCCKRSLRRGPHGRTRSYRSFRVSIAALTWLGGFPGGRPRRGAQRRSQSSQEASARQVMGSSRTGQPHDRFHLDFGGRQLFVFPAWHPPLSAGQLEECKPKPHGAPSPSLETAAPRKPSQKRRGELLLPPSPRSSQLQHRPEDRQGPAPSRLPVGTFLAGTKGRLARSRKSGGQHGLRWNEGKDKTSSELCSRQAPGRGPLRLARRPLRLAKAPGSLASQGGQQLRGRPGGGDTRGDGTREGGEAGTLVNTSHVQAWLCPSPPCW